MIKYRKEEEVVVKLKKCKTHFTHWKAKILLKFTK